MKKALWATFGFLLFISGFSALVLSIVGIELSYLAWLDRLNPLVGLLTKLFMIIGGVVIGYLTMTDWRAENEEN